MFILTSKYFPTDSWPDLYFPVLPDAVVDIQYAEIWDGSVVMNLVIAENVILNKEITDTYSELEAI